tara:strand:+ start:29 stop:430 length:402 start_codon:yes stop_codon:yes gene_type:complete
MQESNFIKKVHSNLPANIYKWKINDPYHGGVPDCFYSGYSGLCFVEYKYKRELPKKPNTLIKFNLSKQQELWLTDRRNEGVPCYAALGVGNLVVFTQEFDQVNKYTKQKFEEEALTFEEFIGKLRNLCVKYDP